MSWFGRGLPRFSEALAEAKAAHDLHLLHVADPVVDPVVDPVIDPSYGAFAGAAGAAEAASSEPASSEANAKVVDAVEPEALDQLPHITPCRAGLYLISDRTGDIGTIQGDYVIGFTVWCWDTNTWYANIEEATAAIARDASAREAARLGAAS